jgi:hypothetical protein
MQLLHLGKAVRPDAAITRNEQCAVGMLNDGHLASDSVYVLDVLRKDERGCLCFVDARRRKRAGCMRARNRNRGCNRNSDDVEESHEVTIRRWILTWRLKYLSGLKAIRQKLEYIGTPSRSTEIAECMSLCGGRPERRIELHLVRLVRRRHLGRQNFMRRILSLWGEPMLTDFAFSENRTSAAELGCVLY